MTFLWWLGAACMENSTRYAVEDGCFKVEDEDRETNFFRVVFHLPLVLHLHSSS